MQSYQQAKIGGFCHIYSGQEAVAVGATWALRDDDPLITAYRDHGHALARGMDPKHCMAEMYGRTEGCAKGKGGSMHMFDKPNHMYGGHAIVGGQMPLGAGLGFAIQYQQKDQVALTFFGDGALNQGATHESLNLAAIWNLPCVFLLENTLYSLGTHLAAKAESYGMRYAQCNGMDALSVYDCIAREVAAARNASNPQWREDAIPQYQRSGTTPGPCFVNAVTYRFQGHSMSDPRKSRGKDEEGKWENADPIYTMVSHLIENDVANQDEIDERDERAKAQAKEALDFADKAEPTPMDELYTDVFAQPFPPFKPGQPHPDFQ